MYKRQALEAKGLKIGSVDSVDSSAEAGSVVWQSQDAGAEVTKGCLLYTSHEAGHAVQYAIGYAPIKLRAAIIPLTQFGSMAAMPLLILGLIPVSYTHLDVYKRQRYAAWCHARGYCFRAGYVRRGDEPRTRAGFHHQGCRRR